MGEFDFLTFEANFSSPRILNAYDELSLWSAMFGLLLLNEIPLSGIVDVLDVGCGTGFPLIELAERLGTQCRVHGIDPWAGGLARAAEKIASRQIKNVSLHEGSASAMPFADDSFDLIVSNLGLNNFEDRATAISECRRVARTGATLALTTNLQGHMQEFYGAFADVLSNDKDALRRLHDHVAHRATITSVRDLLRDGGFVVQRVVEHRGRMRFRDGTALLNHHFIKLGFLDDWKKVAGDDLRAVFSKLLAKLNEIAHRDGELCLTIPMAYVEATAQ